MEETQWTGRTITLKYKLDSFEVFTRAKSSDRWISKKEDLFAVGQELLLHELPLTLRLIGLRVTKLKDLRDTDPSVGIKRFFDAANSSSPNKKRRLSLPENESIEEPPSPGKLENTKPTSSRREKPESKSREAPFARETHTCPVCQKQVPTENDAFNAHLDSCLSRGAIRQAQAEVCPSPKQAQGNIMERWTKIASNSKKEDLDNERPLLYIMHLSALIYPVFLISCTSRM
ncbi:hypothetical protein K438DRAFT_142942 [Mycena galopus ATCC 62051]|nr:hypothetical protein K438DRAFT_142942 [Mycena galopus ATCC 62051]